MTPDEAVEVLGHPNRSAISWDAEREEAARVLRRFVESAPEVACPACGATIRARMADRQDAAELARLREIEKRALNLVTINEPMTARTACVILGERP